MEAVNATAPAAKLDVVNVLLGAAVAPLFHKRALVWFALPVVAIRLALHGAGIAGGLLELALGVPMLLLMVASHRVFILGPKSTSGHGPAWWTGRMARVVGWMIVLGLVFAVAATPVIVATVATQSSDPAIAEPLASWLIVVLGLPAYYVLSRLSLVFPATAIEETLEAGDSWRLSAGNGLRLMLVVWLLPFVLDTVLGYAPEPNSFAMEAFVTLVWLYVFLVEIAALSMAYRELSRGRLSSP